MILKDDAFSSIVHAVEQGRIIFKNIRSFVLYLLSCNLSEILVIGLAVLGGLPLPLLPLQILFLNLVTDVFPAFALGTIEADRNVRLCEQPQHKRRWNWPDWDFDALEATGANFTIMNGYLRGLLADDGGCAGVDAGVGGDGARPRDRRHLRHLTPHPPEPPKS